MRGNLLALFDKYRQLLSAGICILIIFHFPDLHASREVSEKRECSTCHIMWLKEFDRKDVTPLVPYEPKPTVATGKQDVSSTNEMCFSCHDGFVLDSRAVWKSGKHNHPVGIKPSNKITIPTSKGKTVFPLNDDGKVYCGTCHTAHGVDWNQDESPVFLRVKNVESSMCLACHLEKSTGPKEGNHPIFKQPPNKPDKLIQAGSKFAADGGITCQSCHLPHGSDNNKSLVIHNQDSNLCFTCHKDKKSVVNTKHNLQQVAPGASNNKQQTAEESGICGSCHLPHGANGPMLWARNRTSSSDKAAGRCLSCHKEDGLAKDKTVGEHSHPTKVSVKRLGIKVKKGEWHYDGKNQDDHEYVELPLYDKEGHMTSNGNRVSCGSCHDPHSWSQGGEAEKDEDGEFKEGNGNSSFLRIAQGNKSELCTNCHQEKKNIISTKHNVFNNVDISRQDILHGGVCEQCHQPHNAKGPYLRARENKKAAGSSLLLMCKSCHSKGKMAEKKLIEKHSHPLGVGLDNLDTGPVSLPLFDEQGNKVSQGGMLDCASCHDAHNWSPGKVLSDPLKEGDASSSFLRISASHDSKLCLECHKNKKTVLGTDHDLSVSKPDAVNHQGNDVAHSGVCGQCHSVHNAVMGTALWAQQPAEVASKVEQMCLSCHAEGKIAKNKIPPQLQHPDHITAWSNSVREKRITDKPLPDIPVYDDKGRRAHVGLITCLSCHDPHQWQPANEKPGDGMNIEGDAMNSFLRNVDSELIICADCHGADAIFRYKYFHGETSRKKYPLYQ